MMLQSDDGYIIRYQNVYMYIHFFSYVEKFAFIFCIRYVAFCIIVQIKILKNNTTVVCFVRNFYGPVPPVQLVPATPLDARYGTGMMVHCFNNIIMKKYYNIE